MSKKCFHVGAGNFSESSNFEEKTRKTSEIIPFLFFHNIFYHSIFQEARSPLYIFHTPPHSPPPSSILLPGFGFLMGQEDCRVCLHQLELPCRRYMLTCLF